MNGKHVIMFEFVIFFNLKKKIGKVPETEKNANMFFGIIRTERNKIYMFAKINIKKLRKVVGPPTKLLHTTDTYTCNWPLIKSVQHFCHYYFVFCAFREKI